MALLRTYTCRPPLMEFRQRYSITSSARLSDWVTANQRDDLAPPHEFCPQTRIKS